MESFEGKKQWLLDEGFVNIRMGCVGSDCCDTNLEGCKISIFWIMGEKN